MADTLVSEQDPAARLASRRTPMRPYDVMVGPMDHLAAERQRLAELQWDHIDVAPVSATIGAEIGGVDLRDDLDDATISEIRTALHEFKVIFFRDQPITSEQHVAFARRFGELEVHPFIPGNETLPELVRFEKSADVTGYENQWHHDVTWRAEPSMGAMLRAVQVPPTGGDTLFSDMVAAYEGMSDELREKVDGLTATHDFVKAFGANVPEERRAEMREKYPAQEHPVVVRHDVTGRKLLYLNRTFVSHLGGVPVEEAKDLMDLICRQADYPEYQVRFRWQPNSIAFWDNRAAQHYAASDYWPEIRIMERASILGTRPSAA